MEVYELQGGGQATIGVGVNRRVERRCGWERGNLSGINTRTVSAGQNKLIGRFNMAESYLNGTT